MRPIISTGLANFLANGGSIRKAFENCVLNLYDGTDPASADSAPDGDSLCQITLNSGAVAATAVCTPTTYVVIIGSHVGATTFKFDVTVDGVGPTTYTYTSDGTSHTLDQVCLGIAEMLDAIPQLSAISSDNNDGVILVKSRINGLTFTLAATTPAGTGTITSVTLTATATRPNTLQFGPPIGGVISKYVADVWSGVNLGTGVPLYFRFTRPSDSLAYSLTDFRAQGTISTSGDDLNLNNTSLTIGLTTVISTYDFELPKSE